MPNEARQYQPDQVSTRPLDAPLINPGIASPEAYGAGIGRAVSGAAQDIGSTNKMLAIQAQRDKEKAAHTKSINAYLKAREEEGKARNEAQQTTGLNAEGQVEKYKSKLEEIRQRYAKDLQGDDDAIDTFNQMFDQAKADGSVDLDRHERVQRRAVERDSRNALVVQSRMDGLDGVIDIDTSLDRQVGSIADLAEIGGEHPEETGLKVQDAKDKTIAAHVDQQIESGNYADAQKILDSHGDLMSKPARAQIEGKLKAHSDDQKAQNLSDAIFKSGNFKTKGDIDKTIRLIDDEKLRSSVQVKVDREWARMEDAKQEERKNTYEAAAKRIEAGEDAELIIADPESNLTSDDRSALRRYSANVAAGKEPPEGGERWSVLLNEAAVSPNTFMNRKLGLEKGQMSKGEYRQMVEHQAAMRAGMLKSDDKAPIPKGLFTAEEVANNVLRDYGIDPTIKDGKPVDPRSLMFKQQLSKSLIASGGVTKMTEEQIAAKASQLLVKHRIAQKGMFGGESFTEVPRFMLPGMDKVSYDLNSATSEDLTKINQDFLNAGLEQSEISESMVRAQWLNLQASRLRIEAIKAQEAAQEKPPSPFIGGN